MADATVKCIMSLVVLVAGLYIFINYQFISLRIVLARRQRVTRGLGYSLPSVRAQPNKSEAICLDDTEMLASDYDGVGGDY